MATLLAAHVDAILEKGFVALMDASRVDDLKRMYHLFSLVGAHATSLRTAWSKYVKKVGAEMVGDVEREKNLVTELLGFKARLDAVHGGAFESHELFAHSLKEGFECFINTRQNKPAELVARYIDGKLRAGNKGRPTRLEDELDRAMTLFRYSAAPPPPPRRPSALRSPAHPPPSLVTRSYIDGKDMFEAFKKDLSKRLLLGKSASIDAEKSMICKPGRVRQRVTRSSRGCSRTSTSRA